MTGVCVNGHLWTQDNMVVNSQGNRVCLECKRKAWRSWKARQRRKLFLKKDHLSPDWPSEKTWPQRSVR